MIPTVAATGLIDVIRELCSDCHGNGRVDTSLPLAPAFAQTDDICPNPQCINGYVEVRG